MLGFDTDEPALPSALRSQKRPAGVLGLDQGLRRSHRTLGFPQFRLLSLIACRASSRLPILVSPFDLQPDSLPRPPSVPSLQGTVRRLPLSPRACAAIPPAFAPPPPRPASWPSF